MASRLETTGYAFEPTGSTSITATTSSGRVYLQGIGDQILISNLSGSVDAHIELGIGTVTATTSDLVIMARTQVLLSRAEFDNASHLAAITSSGTATLQIETGFGI
jgi:hypothetical protein